MWMVEALGIQSPWLAVVECAPMHTVVVAVPEGVLECRTVGTDLLSWDFQFQYKLLD